MRALLRNKQIFRFVWRFKYDSGRMEDLFKGAQISSKYSAIRDVYPKQIAPVVMNFLREHNPSMAQYPLMVDVACGGGQGTELFAGYFTRVVAFDSSESQIQTAAVRKLGNVDFRVATADVFPCSDASADLVICSSAIHFLDWESFLVETERVLKPGGCLALIGYFMPQVTPLHVQDAAQRRLLLEKASRRVRDFKLQCGYKNWMLHTLDSKYRNFYDLIPWPSKRHDVSVTGELTWSMTQLMSYAESLSNYQRSMAKLREEMSARNPGFSEEELAELDYAVRLRRDIKEIWEVEGEEDDNVLMKVEFPFFLVLGCRRSVRR